MGYMDVYHAKANGLSFAHLVNSAGNIGMWEGVLLLMSLLSLSLNLSLIDQLFS